MAHGVDKLYRNLVGARDGVSVVQVEAGRAHHDVDVCVLAVLVCVVCVVVRVVGLMPVVFMAGVVLGGVVVVVAVVLVAFVVACVMAGGTAAVTVYDDVDVAVIQLVHVLPQLVQFAVHRSGGTSPGRRYYGHQHDELPHVADREKTASSK